MAQQTDDGKTHKLLEDVIKELRAIRAEMKLLNDELTTKTG